MFAELVVLAVSLYFIWMVMDNFFPSIKNPPGPFRLPIVGNGFSLLTNRHQPPFIKFRDWTKKYGGVVYIRMGTEDTVLIDDFDTAKTILNSETWVDRPWDDFMAERSYGQQLGVIFSIGETWKEMRRFTTRSLRDFGFGKQTYMQSIMDDQLKQLLEKLEKVANKNEPLKIKYLFTLSVLNILWGMVSSVRASGDEEKLKKLLVIVDKLARATPIGGTILDIFPELRHILPGPTGATFIRNCNKEQQDYFQEALDARRKEIQEEDSRDFIDLFTLSYHKFLDK